MLSLVGHAGLSAPRVVITECVLLQRAAPASQGSVASLVRRLGVLMVGGELGVLLPVHVRMVDTATLSQVPAPVHQDTGVTSATHSVGLEHMVHSVVGCAPVIQGRHVTM